MGSAPYPSTLYSHKLPATRASIVAQTMMRLIQLICAPIISFAYAPYHLVCIWLSLICNVTLKMLVRLGKPPKWYILAIHSRDLAMALENMQLREDGYRHQMDELKQEVERHDKDRRLAIRKAKKLMAEVAELQGLPPNHTMPTPSLSTPRPTTGRPTLLVLSSLLAMGLALWHFYHSQPVGVVKKVTTSCLFLSLYSGYGALQARSITSSVVWTCCLSWFVVGFVACHHLVMGGSAAA